MAMPSIWLTHAGDYDDAALAGLSKLLALDEAARAAHFVRPPRRRQFILGRALARHAIADAAGIAPHAVLLRDRPGQAPLLVAPSLPLFFSISHSGPWVACAVQAHAAIGLDIEVMDPHRPVLELAAQAFGSEEAAALAAMPAERQVAAFYAQWCRLEAGIKLGGQAIATADFTHGELALALCSAAPFTESPRVRRVRLER